MLSTQAVTGRRSRHDSSGGGGGGGHEHQHHNGCSRDHSQIKRRAPKFDVRQLSGRERNRAIRNAQTDDRVKTLRSRFIDEGWQPKRSEAKATQTVPDKGSPFTTVVLPFSTPEHEDAYIMWTSHGGHQTEGFHSVHFDKSGDGTHDHWRITKYHVDAQSGDITTTTRTLENFLGCNDINVGCVLGIAGAYFGLFATCAACSAGGPMVLPACAGCIGMVMEWARAILCDWCED